VQAARTFDGVRYVVLKEPCCEQYFKMPPALWWESFRAQPIQSFEVTVFASRPPVRYTVARLEP